MNIAAARSLHQRRASVIGWLHAIPADPATINPFTGGPHRSLGSTYSGQRVGPFGETWAPETPIRGYAKGKFSAATLQFWGMIEAGDMELVVLAPFAADPLAGIVAIEDPLLSDYNAGKFYVMDKGKAVAFDRFRFLGNLWAAKAPAVPDIDGSTVFAWRMPVSKVTV